MPEAKEYGRRGHSENQSEEKYPASAWEEGKYDLDLALYRRIALCLQQPSHQTTQ